MRPFIDSNRGRDLDGDGNCRYKVTNCYFELEYPADGQFLVTYVIPINDYTVAVATCWEHYFDGIEQWLADDYSVQTFTETWPLCAQLLVNGIKEQYSQGALIRNADYDTTDQKWFLCTFVGNLNLNNPEDLFCQRTREAERLVVDLSVQLLNDKQAAEPVHSLLPQLLGRVRERVRKGGCCGSVRGAAGRRSLLRRRLLRQCVIWPNPAAAPPAAPYQEESMTIGEFIRKITVPHGYMQDQMTTGPVQGNRILFPGKSGENLQEGRVVPAGDQALAA